MGFYLSIWRSIRRDQRHIKMLERRLQRRDERIERLIEEVGRLYEAQDRLQGKLDEAQGTIRDVRLAVGRVKVLEGHVDTGLRSLAELVAMVASDHDDLERRLDGIVAYLRSFGPDEVPVSAAEMRTAIGKIVQGAEPEIVDLQAGELKEE